MSALKFYLFGLPRVEQESRPIKIERRKSLALAAYLALNREPQSRDILAALLWPEHDQNAARSSLSNALWHLKRIFGRDWLTIEREQVILNLREIPWLDVNEFRSLLAQARAHAHPEKQACDQCLQILNQAAALYREDFMAGFYVPKNEAFEEWKTTQANELRRKFEGVLEKLVQYHDAKGEFEAAIRLAERWLRLDPLNEEVHWHLMRLQARCGQPALALRQYEECVRLLSAELHTRPQAKLSELRKAIQEQRVPVFNGISTEKAQPKKPAKAPWPLGPCIGREKEIEEINRLLDDPYCRLLTLAGPGGIGKTTLALQALHEKNEQSPGTIFFIPLAQLQNAEWIVPTMADALGFSFFKESDSGDQLLVYLQDKKYLLILDNFEHLPDGADLLTEILTRAPGVKFLVTSQQQLNLKEEWVLDVRGLDYPADESIREIEQFGAVRLLLQRLKQIEPRFSLAEDEKPFIIRICRLLDGMPLGIELAAAWSRLLSFREIAAAMDRDPAFLAGPLQNLPERQRSLQAVFERSWGFLIENEKEVFKKLSVFQGGFTAEAARQAAGASMPTLLSLIKKSFLRRCAKDRYQIPESLRRFGEDMCRKEPATMEAVRALHAAYYGRLFDKPVEYFMGEEQIKILEGIRTEIDNFRLGWQWAVAHRECRIINYYLDYLFEFYKEKGWFSYGEEALSGAIETLRQSSEPSPEIEATVGKMLSIIGWFCHYQARPEQAQNLIREGMEILRRLDRKKDLAKSCYRLGYDLFFTGQLEEAEDLIREGISIFEASGDRMGMTDCRRLIANIKSVQGKYEEAQNGFDESLAVYRELGNMPGIYIVYDCLGIMLESQGKYIEAVRIHERSIAYYRKIEEGWELANSLNNLGFACFGNGEFERSEQCFKDAVKMTIRNQVMPILQEAVTGMAFCLARKGRKEPASEIVAYIAQDATVHIDVRKRAERLLEELRTEFDEEIFSSIMLKGRSRSLQYFLDMLHEA